MRITEQRKFPALIRDFVLAHGGHVVDEDFALADNGEHIPSWELSIPTRVGALRVRPREDWVACRFEDLERARSRLQHDARLNRHSGKWNHHFHNQNRADVAAAYFNSELRRILPTADAAPKPEE